MKTIPNENLRAIIYARYSSDSQREESIEGQLRECKEFAEKNGITVFASYIDRYTIILLIFFTKTSRGKLSVCRLNPSFAKNLT